MIRGTSTAIARSRIHARCLALIASLSVAAGCSTFTDNSIAAKANGRELSIDGLNRIAADFPKLTGSAAGVDESNEFAGDTVREVLTRWVQGAALLADLGERGIVVDETARAEAAAQYEASDAATWTTLSPETRDLLVDFTIGRQALANDEAFVSESSVQSTYDDGVTASGVLCIRIMAFETEAEAAAVKTELDGGADFAEIANEHPLDPAAEPTDGVFLDQQTGSPCLQAADYAVLAQAAASTPVGESTPPLPLDTFFFLVLQRPYAEVVAEARSLIAPVIAESIVAEVLSVADVTIDSRYGMWDAEAGTVVPAR